MKSKNHTLHLFLLALLTLCGAPSVSAQVILQGTVRNAATRNPEPSANVMLQTADGRGIFKYMLTGDDGKYEFSYSGDRDSLMIAVSGFNIKPRSKVVAARSQTVDFDVTVEALEIREVIVKAPPVTRRSDTLTYNVASFSDDADRSIGDVIKKMPGLEVAKSGQISYQGKAINKFYIEDMDMLQGRYGIATNNIQAKDIASVQVYENHQPVKALKDVQSSNDAALNIKLKNSAKGTFNAVMQAGVGYKPFMWNGEIVPMYFTGKFQTMWTYKTNNTGEDVSKELTSHYGGSEQMGGMLRVASPSTPSFDRQRYLNNNIHTVSANGITKLDKETTLTANATYLHDRQLAQGSSLTTYLFPDQAPVMITEVIRHARTTDQTDASLLLEANKDKFYLKDKVSFSGRWNSDRGNVFDTEDNVTQRLTDRSLSFRNDFSFIKVLGYNRISLSSNTSYREQPMTLAVTPLLYRGVFGDGEYEGVLQDVSTRRFTSTNSVFTGRSLGKFFLSLNGALNVNANTMNSSLGAFGAASGQSTTPADTMRNDMTYRRFDVKLGPGLSYDGYRLSAGLYIPLDYMFLNINDRIDAENGKDKKKLFVAPSMNFTWKVHYNLKLSGNASYYINSGGDGDNYSGFIMTNYRTIGNRKGEIRESRMQNYSLSLNYGNALKSLFGSLDARYLRAGSNLMYGTVFSGPLSWVESYPIENFSDSYIFGGKLSKRFQQIATTLGISGQYMLSFSDVLRQGEIINTRSDMYNAGFNATTRFGRLARLDYDLSWMRSLTSAQGVGAGYAPIDIVRQEATLVLFISQKMNLRLGGEHYYNSAISGGGRNMFFADAALGYKAKRMEYILEARNLFGTGSYNSANYADMLSYIYSYALRPRSVMFKIKFSLK